MTPGDGGQVDDRAAALYPSSTRIASRQPRNVPSTLTASVRRNSSRVAVSMLPLSAMPALLTRMSSLPKAATTRVDHLAPARFVGHVLGEDEIGDAFEPGEARLVAVGRRHFRALGVKQRAVARPMPEAAPVISAALPASRPGLSGIVCPPCYAASAPSCGAVGRPLFDGLGDARQRACHGASVTAAPCAARRRCGSSRR